MVDDKMRTAVQSSGSKNSPRFNWGVGVDIIITTYTRGTTLKRKIKRDGRYKVFFFSCFDWTYAFIDVVTYIDVTSLLKLLNWHLL